LKVEKIPRNGSQHPRNEFVREWDEPIVRVIYPDGIHSTIA
jgi:hypothetical protein